MGAGDDDLFFLGKRLKKESEQKKKRAEKERGHEVSTKGLTMGLMVEDDRGGGGKLVQRSRVLVIWICTHTRTRWCWDNHEDHVALFWQLVGWFCMEHFFDIHWTEREGGSIGCLKLRGERMKEQEGGARKRREGRGRHMCILDKWGTSYAPHTTLLEDNAEIILLCKVLLYLYILHFMPHYTLQ